ncbi:MAG: NfeD family protein [Armatimonadota bacterium]|jgi:membrane protein implicated in regulation of membrane protease activity
METYGIWIIAGVIALIIDLLSGTMFMLWVAGGCFVAGVVAAAFPSLAWAPWAAFVGSTAILLYLGRPLAERFHQQKLIPSNVDALVGQEGIVLETIDPISNTGRVRIGSEEWRARSDEHIEPGQRVCVLGVEGATVVVTGWDPRSS